MPHLDSLSPKASWITTLLVGVLLIGAAAVGLRHASPPAAVAADAGVSSFSSKRAMTHLQRIAVRPHPIGSEENAHVRDYLLQELRALGFDPQVQTALGLAPKWGNAGMAQNVLVRVPGRRPGKALMLVAHYDSVPYGPGAADDGASVAAILETLRALKTEGQLQNDLICLFSDGEEPGLLGADAFVTTHPWATQVGFVLNFEYRGSSGPVLMFETGEGNGRAIAGLAHAPHPMANSLMYDVYKRMPNDTDFTVFRRAGLQGMNFAAVEGLDAYHSAHDLPERLNEATLQHEGETMLSLVRHFGNAPLEEMRSTDSVYFDMPGIGLVHYSMDWRWPLFLAATALAFAAWIVAKRSGELRSSRILPAALAFSLTVALLPQIGRLAKAGMLPWPALAADTVFVTWMLLALVLLVLAAFLAACAALTRWLRPVELAFGAVACWLILLAAANLYMPGGSFLLTWPLLPVLLSLTVLWSGYGKALSSEAKAWILAAGAVPGLIFFAPLVRMICIALTLDMAFVPLTIAMLLLGLMTPLLSMLSRRWLPAFLPLASLAIFVLAGFTGAHPAGDRPPARLIYVHDDVVGKDFWLSTDEKLDERNRPFFPGEPVRRKVPEIFGDAPWTFWVAAAPALETRTPVIEVKEDGMTSDGRKIRLRVASPRNASQLQLFVEGNEVRRAHAGGRSFSETTQPMWMLNAYGVGASGIDVDLLVAPNKPFRIKAIDTSYQLPTGATGTAVSAAGMDVTTQVVAHKDFR